MKVRHNILQLIALLVSLAVIDRSRAGTVSIVEVDNGGISDMMFNLAGTRTYDFRLSTPSTEFIAGQQLYSQLNQGVFIQHPVGSIGPPQSSLFGVVPTLQFDTFVASGIADRSINPLIIAASYALGSPNPPAPAVFTPTTLDVTYGPQLGQVTTGASNYLTARLTLSPNAQGFLRYAAGFFDGAPLSGPMFDLRIVNGQIVPEPSSGIPIATALLALMFQLRIRRGKGDIPRLFGSREN
ncbi:MAG: hypothetical protein WD669_01685 [Pirellulales bacterium]